jgi:hypothetical protein
MYAINQATNHYVSTLDHAAGYWLNFLLNGGLLIREWQSSEFTNAGGVKPITQTTLTKLFDRGLVEVVKGKTITYLAPTQKVCDQSESVNWWVE